jgi:murein L,D-transpeptidase YafK
MTAENLTRHAQDPNASFWQMLKTGNDAFLAGGQPPQVAVCDRRYVFNSIAIDRDRDPSGPCPPETSGQSSIVYQARDQFAQKVRQILREH